MHNQIRQKKEEVVNSEKSEFMDRPLSLHEEDDERIQKCETWEQIIKVIEDKEKSRKK